MTIFLKQLQVTFIPSSKYTLRDKKLTSKEAQEFYKKIIEFKNKLWIHNCTLR